jgi:hypothetical protein
MKKKSNRPYQYYVVCLKTFFHSEF